MFSLRSKLLKIRFRYEDFTKAQNKVLGTIIRQGARLWLKTLLTGIRNAPYSMGDSFPIWSGMAKGSLQPLGRYLHMSVPVAPRPPYYSTSVSKKTYRTVRHLRRPPNNVAEGNTKQAFEIRDDANLSGTLRFSFNFENLVEYFGINDLEANGKFPSTPWAILNEANDVMVAFVNSEIETRLPKLTDYLDFEAETTHG